MEKRLDKIAKQLGGDKPVREQILFVNVRQWPESDQEAYLAGDDATRSDLIEKHTGRRPPPPGRFISMVIDLPIPPMDPIAAAAEADRIVRQGTN